MTSITSMIRCIKGIQPSGRGSLTESSVFSVVFGTLTQRMIVKRVKLITNVKGTSQSHPIEKKQPQCEHHQKEVRDIVQTGRLVHEVIISTKAIKPFA